jgi:hypothetical protein
MNELTPQQEKKLRKLANLVDQGSVAIIEYLLEIEEKMEQVAPSLTEVITRMKGDKGEKGDQGERGEAGRDGTDGVDGINGINGVDGRNGIDGRNGVDGRNGIDGLDGLNGKDGSPDTPDQIIAKLAKVRERLLEILELDGRDTKLSNDLITRAIGIVDQRTSFLINKVSNLQTQVNNLPTGGSGASAFIDLTDVPASYTGEGQKFVKVNVAEDGLEFVAGSGVAVAWGDITGTLADQTDLQTELDTKKEIWSGADIVVASAGGDYTDIQTALDNVPAGGGNVYVSDGTYTITATLVIPTSRTKLIVSDGATIQCNGASVATLIQPDTSVAICEVVGGKWLQTNATAQGVAFDFSNSSNNRLAPTRVEEFGTAFKFSDTSNLTFYNLTERTQVFNCNNGIELSGSLANNNTFLAMRIKPKNGGAGKGIALTDARGNLFMGVDVEPSTATGITGIHLISSSASVRARENTFINCWVEENATNVLIDADCVHNTFQGCTFAGTGGALITDNSTAQTNLFINCNANSGDVPFNWLGTITDRNRNELIKFTETASAINEITIANAASGSNPTISATGGGTNVGINLTPKGTGTVVSAAPVTFSTGLAVTAGNYEVGRDADATNQMHFNVPTGATFEFSVNDVSQLTLSNSVLDLQGNNLQNATIVNFGDSTSFELPNSAAPTVNADGEIAVDTTVTDFSHGILKYYSTEEVGVVAMPIAEFTSPTNGGVPTYNSTTDEFELTVPSGSGDVVGPASSTDNAVVRFDSTTGKLLQNSTVTIGDAGGISTTIADTGNETGLTIVQNDVTNNARGASITNTGTGNDLRITDSGSKGSSNTGSGALLINMTHATDAGIVANIITRNDATTRNLLRVNSNPAFSTTVAGAQTIDTSDTQLTVTSTTGFPSSGTLRVTNNTSTTENSRMIMLHYTSVDATHFIGTAGVFYKESASIDLVDLALVDYIDSTQTASIVEILDSNSNGGMVNLKLTGLNPDIEFVAKSGYNAASGEGKFEIDVPTGDNIASASTDCLRFNGRSDANSGFVTSMIVTRPGDTRQGMVGIGFQNRTDPVTLAAHLHIKNDANIDSGAAALIGQIIQGADSQSANLTEWRNNSGTVLSSVSSAGTITAPTIIANTTINPDANDGATLGQSGTAFSDLFLASGAVVDFAAGNSVITHSSAVLTVSTGDLRVTTAGTNSASVVTVGGTQTLTAKTLTTPTIASFANANHNHADSAGGGQLGDSAIADTADVKISSITYVIDGGGSAITTGIKGDLEIPFACTINRVTMLADQSGSAVVDIWKDSYANYPPTDADTITASAPPTITTAVKSQDTTLTGWTTTITAGDTLRFNVDSATTITRLTISLKITKS